MKLTRTHLVCPICGFRRLIDADPDVKTEMIPEKDVTPRKRPDFYQKCPCCKNQIGIRKVP